MKRLSAIAIALCLLFAVSGAAGAQTLIVGTSTGFEPFEYLDNDGNPAGFDIEIARYVAAYAQMELSCEDISFDDLIKALNYGMIDFVAAAMTITEERRMSVDFSEPYFDATQAVIVLKGDSRIAENGDVAGLKVAAQKDTTGHFAALDLLGCAKEDMMLESTPANAVQALISGEADCVIIDRIVADRYVRGNETLAIAEGVVLPVEEYGLAVMLGNYDLLDTINAALADMKASGKYDELLARYFAQ